MGISRKFSSRIETRNNLYETPDEVSNVPPSDETVSFASDDAIPFCISNDGTAFITRPKPDGSGYDTHLDLYACVLPSYFKDGNDPAEIDRYESRNNILIFPRKYEDVAKLDNDIGNNVNIDGRLFTEHNAVTFWKPISSIFPKIDGSLKRIIRAVNKNPDDFFVEYWVDAKDPEIDPRLRKAWDDGRGAPRSLLIPYPRVNEFIRSIETDDAGILGRERHVAASKGISSPYVLGFGSDRAQELANSAGYRTPAEMHAAHPFESAPSDYVKRLLT